MGQNRVRIFILFLLICCLLLPKAKAADEDVSNARLLKEIKGLKDTAEFQAAKIRELEKRLSAQEERSKSGGSETIPGSELEAKIDERINKKIPTFQLLEGLDMGVSITSVLQSARNANADTQLGAKEDVTDGSYSADISFEKEFQDYATAYISLHSGDGAGLTDDLKLFSSVNADASDCDGNVFVNEAWYEHYLKSIPLTVTFGKLDPTYFIDTNEYANNETSQFLADMFVNSCIVEFPSDNAAGIRFGFQPGALFDIDAVVLDGDSDWEDIFDGIFLAGQINFKPKIFDRPGNYRLLAWRNNQPHTKWTDTSRDKEIGFGFGLSLDQKITDLIGVFARYGWQNPEVYLPSESFSLRDSFSLGAQLKGCPWGRPDDVLGLAFGQIFPSKKYKSANDLQAKTESHFECYYNFKVNDHLSLSPDLQVIWQPYGKDAANGDGTIVVGGLRGQVDF